MTSGGIDVVDSRYAELAVCGYVRKNYRYAVPISIVNLMESFYSLWITKRLSSEQLQRLKEMQLGQEFGIPFHSLRMKGFRMEVVLKASRNNIYGEMGVFLSLEIIPSPEMDFMAGNFAVAHDGEHFVRSYWKRATANDYTPYISTDFKCLRGLRCQNRDNLSIAAYIDINQIKWKKEAKEDFDITPTLKGYDQHRWLIDDDVITKLNSEPNGFVAAECQSQNGWIIKIYRCCGQQKLRMFTHPPFKPMNVQSVIIETTVQWNIDGKRRCFKGVSVYGEVACGLTFDGIQSIPELIFQWKIVGVKGTKGQDIPVSDWLSNGIDIGESQ